MQTHDDIEPPPFFRTWRRLYLVVFLNLALLIAGFWVFTRIFS